MVAYNLRDTRLGFEKTLSTGETLCARTTIEYINKNTKKVSTTLWATDAHGVRIGFYKNPHFSEALNNAALEVKKCMLSLRGKGDSSWHLEKESANMHFVVQNNTTSIFAQFSKAMSDAGFKGSQAAVNLKFTSGGTAHQSLT